jgi:hypothetical protein
MFIKIFRKGRKLFNHEKEKTALKPEAKNNPKKALKLYL